MRKKLILFGLIIAALTFGAVVFVYSPFGVVLHQTSGAFTEKRLNSIIRKLKTLNLKNGEEARFYLKDLNDPEGLLQISGDEKDFKLVRRINIWAMGMGDGRLKASIMTRNLGHAGYYGFAYSDIDLPVTPYLDNEKTIDVPGPMSLVDEKENSHWYRIYTNLN